MTDMPSLTKSVFQGLASFGLSRRWHHKFGLSSAETQQKRPYLHSMTKEHGRECSRVRKNRCVHQVAEARRLAASWMNRQNGESLWRRLGSMETQYNSRRHLEGDEHACSILVEMHWSLKCVKSTKKRYVAWCAKLCPPGQAVASMTDMVY